MKIRYFLPSITWAAIILFLSLTPSNQMPEINIWELFSFDKAAHLFFYALFTLQLIVAFKKQNFSYILKYQSVLSALFISLIYGVMVEMLQYYTLAGRRADYLDIIANILGTFIGCALFSIIYNQPIKQYQK